MKDSENRPTPRFRPPTAAEFAPDVTVAAVIVAEGRLLMVEERCEGRLVFNQPAGHLEPDESLVAAAARETLEETAWDVTLTHFIGVYQWTRPNDGRHFLRFAFAGRPLRHHADRALDVGIVRAIWLTPEELQDCRARHRSPLVWRAAADFLAGQRYPLGVVAGLE